MKKSAIYFDKTHDIGNPLFQDLKQHLNNSSMVKNEMWDTYLFLVDLLCYLGLCLKELALYLLTVV